MTTRDPRYRDRAFPDQGGGIDPTQSLSIDGEDVDRDSHPSLALGTHEAAEAAAREERTRIESPGGRVKTPPPPSAKRPPPVPRGDGEPERVGQTLGSYKILELLGKGGMGYVFRAEHVKLGREVALKLLRSDYAKRRDAVARFFQEARTVNRVRHRNIVDVTDFVELDDGTTFIIMELLRGQSLGRWARTGIDMPRALAVLVQICDGLAAAHSVGVVHRDLKPDNVIVVPTSDGAELVKLLDFGVAKLLNRDDEDVGFQTQAGSVIGTPAYMSPEQAGGMSLDHRSDIYSLGAIMYELFCGTPMFRGRSFGEYVRKHLTEMPVPPSQTEAGKLVDPRLEQIILCCLQKDPDQRFPTIPILRDALLGILGAIETHPPSFATSSHRSGQHVEHSGMIPRQLAPGVAAVMPTMLPPNPQQQQMLATILPGGTSRPDALGVPMPGLLPSAPYHAPASYTQHPSTYIPPQGTPWWVWAVGGTIAVGLGISAAVWYAGRDTASSRALASSQPVTAVRPSVETIVTEIDVHFDATPRAQVFAEGNPSPLCQTPCPVHIDLNDGGAKTQRTFVLRAAGFQDESLIVDLAPSAPRAFRVPLDPAPTIAAEPPKPPDEVVVRTELEPEEPPPKRGTKRVTRSTKAGTKAAKPVTTAAEPPPRETTPTPLPEPKPKPKKPDPAKIDQAQTLDPFRKSK